MSGMDKNHFNRIEKRIQGLIEGGFARLFAGRLQAREVAMALARAMEDNAQVDSDAHLAAPNRYIVRLHPSDHEALVRAQPDLAARLAQHLIDLARESEMRLDALPDVVLSPDEAVSPFTVQVTARCVASAVNATQAMVPVKRPPDLPEAEKLPVAFLVVDGDRYVPLDRAVINIGRRHDNTIVIDDPRVSRQHAQLRLRFGHFVLYDLGSRGGTTVNNLPVAECVLRANDVISLAGVRVVYVEDEGTPSRSAARGSDTQVRATLPMRGAVPPKGTSRPEAPGREPDALDDLLDGWEDEDGDGGY